MRKQLAEVLLTAALLSSGSTMPEMPRGTRPPNGNSRRKHRVNVKRKRLRRISSASRAINR
jgi:hypothetical protein